MLHFLKQFGDAVRVHYLHWEDAAAFYGQEIWEDWKAEYGVTIIRNPVDRNISDFWAHYLDYKTDRPHPTPKPDDMTEFQYFLSAYRHDLAINFPKLELEQRWGADIFSKEYTPPYTMFDNLIVTRVEDLDEFAASVGCEFPKQGVGGYDKSVINVPESYKYILYNTKYYKHFYADKREAL